MTQILKGKPAADVLKEDIIKRVDELKGKGFPPKLNVIRVGERADDISYEKSIIKNCEALGIEAQLDQIPEDSTTEDLLKLLEASNEDKTINGILIFRPLPKHIDEEAIKMAIDPGKDVDCMSPINLEKVFEGDFSSNVPATPMAAIKIMEHYGINLEGKNIAVINRSMVFGRPFAMMALDRNATPMICHSRTKDLADITKNMDIVVTAQGRAKALGKEYFNEDSIIVDVGMSLDSDGKLSGDADFDNLEEYVSMITPSPGGVGAMTTSILLEQVVNSCDRMNK